MNAERNRHLRRNIFLLAIVACTLISARPTLRAEQERPPTAPPRNTDQPANPNAYGIGKPTLQDLWVDPENGHDDNTGATRAQALRTITAAWDRIPKGTLASNGYRILLVRGHYPAAAVPGWMASRHGTFQFPVILQAADGPHTARLHGYLDINDVYYLYLINLDIVTDRGYGGGGNVVHFAACDHILLRGCRLNGYDGQERRPQEALKVNQTKHLYVEDCDIGGAFWFALDLVAVQYGHIMNSRLHSSGDHGAVLKGGTSYFRVEGNEIFDCEANGFMAGQGTGFEFMASPWLHYEAYDIKFVNNVVHDTTGAGMGVNGGYNILLAFNTLYRVGRRSHAIEVALGIRGCDGDAARCQANRAVGGWGLADTGGEEPIPNRSVFIYNNIVYNPGGYQSEWQHLAVRGPGTPSPGSNIPSPAKTDANLQIRGNLIWNGPPNHPLGVEEPGEGCQPSNPTCNGSQLRRENTINAIEPALIDSDHQNFRLAKKHDVSAVLTYAIPDFSWTDAPARPAVPSGALSNSVPVDRDGHKRSPSGPPGAYTDSPPRH